MLVELRFNRYSVVQPDVEMTDQYSIKDELTGQCTAINVLKSKRLVVLHQGRMYFGYMLKDIDKWRGTVINQFFSCESLDGMSCDIFPDETTLWAKIPPITIKKII